MASHAYLAKCCWVAGNIDWPRPVPRSGAHRGGERAPALPRLRSRLRGSRPPPDGRRGRHRAARRPGDLPLEESRLPELDGVRGGAEGVGAVRAAAARSGHRADARRDRAVAEHGHEPATPGAWLGLLGSAESGRGNAEAALRLVRQAVALETRGEERA